jgi:hypothetical protein
MHAEYCHHKIRVYLATFWIEISIRTEILFNYITILVVILKGLGAKTN